jgi:hypothetical protein
MTRGDGEKLVMEMAFCAVAQFVAKCAVRGVDAGDDQAAFGKG